MYVKKVNGPRAVTLPNGRIITRADLPAPNTSRWVASRKAMVVIAVTSGLITRAEALKRWSLSEEELESWMAAARTFGENGLKTTYLQRYRQP